jgi:hypothetical protein
MNANFRRSQKAPPARLTGFLGLFGSAPWMLLALCCPWLEIPLVAQGSIPNGPGVADAVVTPSSNSGSTCILTYEEKVKGKPPVDKMLTFASREEAEKAAYGMGWTGPHPSGQGNGIGSTRRKFRFQEIPNVLRNETQPSARTPTPEGGNDLEAQLRKVDKEAADDVKQGTESLVEQIRPQLADLTKSTKESREKFEQDDREWTKAFAQDTVQAGLSTAALLDAASAGGQWVVTWETRRVNYVIVGTGFYHTPNGILKTTSYGEWQTYSQPTPSRKAADDLVNNLKSQQVPGISHIRNVRVQEGQGVVFPTATFRPPTPESGMLAPQDAGQPKENSISNEEDTYREVTPEEGKAIADHAAKTMESYAKSGITYLLQEPGKKAVLDAKGNPVKDSRGFDTFETIPPPPNTRDCSRFCTESIQGAGLDYKHTGTGGLDGCVGLPVNAANTNKQRLKRIGASDARAGDIIRQVDHMGIYTGKSFIQSKPNTKLYPNRRGEATYIAYDMGKSFPQLSAPWEREWGPGGYIQNGTQTRFYRVMVRKK